jgi:putative peptidoglycan lipid II flippase
MLSTLGIGLAHARDAGLAAIFGVSGVTDAFFVATIIPTAVATVAISGTLAPAVLPIFAQSSRRSPRQAWAIANVILTVSGIALLILAGGMMLTAPALVHYLASGFDAPTTALTTRLVVLAAPILTLLGVSGLLGVAFLSIVLVASRWGIQDVALGMVLGALTHAIVQIVALYRRGWRYVPSLVVRDPAVREVFRLFLPLAAFVALAQAVPLIERAVASTLPTGQLSLLTYAGKLYQVPGVILTGSLVAVLFPLLAHHHSEGEAAQS